MSFAGTNYWAILIAAGAGWIAGAAWYMSLGKYWQEAIGMTAEQMAECRRRPHAWVPFVLAFLANLVMAWTLAGILGHFGTVNAPDHSARHTSGMGHGCMRCDLTNQAACLPKAPAFRPTS